MASDPKPSAQSEAPPRPSASSSSASAPGGDVLAPTFPSDCRACKGAQQLMDAFSRFRATGDAAAPSGGRAQPAAAEHARHGGARGASAAAAGAGAGTGAGAAAGSAESVHGHAGEDGGGDSAHAGVSSASAAGPSAVRGERLPCPLTSGELGGSSWAFLHTTAAYYPEAPTHAQQALMRSMMEGLAEFYPCGYCAEHLREQFKAAPPDVASRTALSMWLCGIHNEVNELVGKPTFDCSRVMERWRDGPADGSCND